MIVYQARIFWDQKDYKSVELTLEASYDICYESQVFRTNLAHSIYMQGATRYTDAIQKYEGLLADFDLLSNLLSAETIVLANLCVCYLITKQSDKAEELIGQIEQQENIQKSLQQQRENGGAHAASLHLCIVNLVIGTLYCSKGNFDFGIRLIVKSLNPGSEKLGTDTWYYTKRCLLALIENIVKRQYSLQESLYAHIIIFLDEAYQVGKNITTVLFPSQQ